MSLDSVDFEARFRDAAATLGLPKLAEARFEETNALDSDATVVAEEAGGDDERSVAVAADDDGPVTAQNFFQHPDTHPVLLDLVLLRKYGPEWMVWEHEVVEVRARADFKVSDVSDINMHKIQAMKTLHFIDTFWEEWHVFAWCCMAFNGVAPDFKVMQVPTVSQCMVAVDIANRVRQDVKFSAELNDYLEQVHMHDGIFVPIEPLEWVTMDDVEDYPVDIEEIQRRWPDVRKEGKQLPSTTVENEQLNRMLDVREYLEDSRAALRAQLPLVIHV
jgi:hypothetical protein